MKITLLIAAFACVFLCSCKDEKKPGPEVSSDTFEVSGTIKNNTAKIVYLEQVGRNPSESLRVDSSEIDKAGKYKLKGKRGQSSIYNLRLDGSQYPVASLINDASTITLDITLNPGRNEFAENYEVKGSEASKEMKDFIYNFNTDLKDMYTALMMHDSLRSTGAVDSVVQMAVFKKKEVSDKIRSSAINSLNKANDPSLLLFELGYYQANSNNPQFELRPLNNEEVMKLIHDGAAKFPNHKILADINKAMDAEMQKTVSVSLVGKQAPDFTLPDVNGTPVALSSFKGKYVLVDFWASWCGPCRAENPNVVVAYNKFRNKNFTVLGVSLDRPGEKDKWVGAIKKDKLNWTQVSDLKDWESVVVDLYHFGERGIPYNVLLDPTGKVIAEALRGEMLEAKLTEVLK